MSPQTDIPEGAVVITTADIYRQLIELTREMSELRGAVAKLAEREKDIDDHESRLRALERGRWPLPALAALIALASLITTIYSSSR
jgi:hypothetical protein